MLRSAIGGAWDGGAILRRASHPLVWTGFATLVATGTLAGPVPLVVGVPLLVGIVAAASSIAVWRTRQRSPPLDPRTIAFVASGDGLWDYDLRTTEIHYDDRCATMLGYEAGSIGSHLGAWGKLVHPGDLSRARDALDAFVRGTSPNYEVEVRLRAADGGWRRVLDKATVVERDDEGRPARLVGVHRLLPDTAEIEVPQSGRRHAASVLGELEKALAAKRSRAVRIEARVGEDLGVGWVERDSFARALARVLDAIASGVPEGTVIPVRPRAPREVGMIGFSLMLPGDASVHTASPDIDAARSMLHTSGARLRVRADQIVIELPAGRGRAHLGL